MIGLAACGSAAAGASDATKPGGAAQPAAASAAASHVDPGGPAAPATVPKRILLCLHIPGLTRMSVTRTPLPPYRVAREEPPGELTVGNAAMVPRVASTLCALPATPELRHVFRGSFRALSPLP